MTLAASWHAPAALPPLEGCGLWTVDLDAPSARAATDLLCDDERARMGRFVFERDRLRFAAGRAALRWLLGSTLDRDPKALRFDVGAHGKPSLADDPQLPFNLSHSGGTALVAIDAGRRHRAIGVDVELHRTVADALSLAHGLFDPQEQAGLAALSGAARDLAFLRAWTRKEACIKASGAGFSAGSIPATGIDDAPRHAQFHDGTRVWLCSLTLPGALGALAMIEHNEATATTLAPTKETP